MLTCELCKNSDVWILKGLYPGITPNSIIGADGVGIIQNITDGSFKPGTRVLINPGRGWINDPRGPEDDYFILGLLPCIGKLNNKNIFYITLTIYIYYLIHKY